MSEFVEIAFTPLQDVQSAARRPASAGGAETLVVFVGADLRPSAAAGDLLGPASASVAAGAAAADARPGPAWPTALRRDHTPVLVRLDPRTAGREPNGSERRATVPDRSPGPEPLTEAVPKRNSGRERSDPATSADAPPSRPERDDRPLLA